MRFQCGVVLVISEAWKVSVLAIVILWSSWPADTLVRFQCGSAGDKWGLERCALGKTTLLWLDKLYHLNFLNQPALSLSVFWDEINHSSLSRIYNIPLVILAAVVLPSTLVAVNFPSVPGYLVQPLPCAIHWQTLTLWSLHLQHWWHLWVWEVLEYSPSSARIKKTIRNQLYSEPLWETDDWKIDINFSQKDDIGSKRRQTIGLWPQTKKKTLRRNAPQVWVLTKWTKTLYKRDYFYCIANFCVTVLNIFSKEIISTNTKMLKTSF